MVDKKINKILVPLDGSKNSIRALEMAISIAKQFEATITGVYSINIQPHSEFQGVTSISKEWKNEAKNILDDAKKLSQQSNVNFKEKIMQGNVGYNLIKMAHDKKENFSLIVMGSRGRSAMKELFLGSVSNYVIHTSKIPVLIVK
ncbi:universal stress protein [Nitrosarchaeum sp.]|nr:universal stress protein [Nitrosarchaeum sp.]